MKTKASMLVLLLPLTALSPAQETKPGSRGKILFENNFENAAVDKMPEGFLVIDGDFAVKQEGNNKFLELPGAPLDTFGALFGPTERDGVAVTARIFGLGKGRRFPTFGVSVNGAGGYKLQVSPGKKALEIYKGDTVKTSVPYEWESGKWTRLRVHVRQPKEGEWRVEGKAWPDGGHEPAWMIALDEKEAPPAGRAGIWGSPYATTPIWFDDLVVAAAEPK